MPLSTLHIPETIAPAKRRVHSNGHRQINFVGVESPAKAAERRPAVVRPRVFVAVENRQQREALSRVLIQSGKIEVVGTDMAEPFQTEDLLKEDLLKEETDILILSSRGNGNEDLTAVRKVRLSAPNVKILLIGVTGAEADFLQCVRAGVHGYLPGDASAEDVVEGVRALQGGEAICPGTLCATLFRYFEREATSFPSASVHQRLGLTRREQQLIPLIAEGLTNKEIANRFCLSEQTVKNHLYRMKHKVGAEDRLSIVQGCRTRGFMP